MKEIYLFLLSEIILLPLIIGLVRLPRIKRSSYQPFFIYIILGAFWEVLNFFLITVLHAQNVAALNIFFLLEWLLIAWQFHNWGLLRGRKTVFYIVVAIPCLVWISEYLIFGQLYHLAPYYHVLYCFLIVLFSVNTINFMITHDYRNLFKNPTFLICIAFIIYFIYRIIFNWAYQTSLKGATETTSFIIMLIGYINALTNIIFAVALLRIPPPQKFTLE
ncbi:hypothetical protein [Puia dinghuensis]|uniref:Uncharacterized protein n=1 Tax=Puia dinghuensis TaxID=1792502 RepID=A0A8J2UGJ1_9BACT|nr:hypothetical protein [Puia dinghuensis]GGB14185.1 hypothetical protein GCM10011511_42450 [Puia dinghuensis]